MLICQWCMYIGMHVCMHAYFFACVYSWANTKLQHRPNILHFNHLSASLPRDAAADPCKGIAPSAGSKSFRAKMNVHARERKRGVYPACLGIFLKKLMIPHSRGKNQVHLASSPIRQARSRRVEYTLIQRGRRSPPHASGSISSASASASTTRTPCGSPSEDRDTLHMHKVVSYTFYLDSWLILQESAEGLRPRRCHAGTTNQQLHTLGVYDGSCQRILCRTF